MKELLAYIGAKNGIYRAKGFLENRFLVRMAWDKAAGEATYEVLPILSVGGYKWVPSFKHGYPLRRVIKTDCFGQALEELQTRIRRSSLEIKQSTNGTTVVLNWNGQPNSVWMCSSRDRLHFNVQYGGDAAVEIEAQLDVDCLTNNDLPAFLSQDLVTANGKKLRLTNVV